MAKDKQYFCLIEIGFMAKKEDGLHFIYSIYSIFYLISKIIWVTGSCTDFFFFSFFLLLLFNLVIVIIVILLLSLLFIIVMLFLCLLHF